MILTKEQAKEFEDVCRPLIKWLNDNAHPHVAAIVTPNHAELNEGVCAFPCDDYIKD